MAVTRHHDILIFDTSVLCRNMYSIGWLDQNFSKSGMWKVESKTFWLAGFWKVENGMLFLESKNGECWRNPIGCLGQIFLKRGMWQKVKFFNVESEK